MCCSSMIFSYFLMFFPNFALAHQGCCASCTAGSFYELITEPRLISSARGSPGQSHLSKVKNQGQQHCLEKEEGLANESQLIFSQTRKSIELYIFDIFGWQKKLCRKMQKGDI